MIEEQMEFGLIKSLLPKPQAMREEEELDSDTEEILRETTVLVLRLFYARAMTQLQNMEQELELLRNAPPSPMLAPESEDPRDKQRNVEESDWKLDIPLTGGPDGKGPLMDIQGKVSLSYLEFLITLLIYYSSLFDRLQFYHPTLGSEHVYRLKFLDPDIDYPPCLSTNTWRLSVNEGI